MAEDSAVPMTAPGRTAYEDGMRVCSLCGQFKSPSEFYSKGGRINQLERRCKPCFNMRNAQSVSAVTKKMKDRLDPSQARSPRKSNRCGQDHLKSLARQRLGTAIKRGLILKPATCSVCGIAPEPAIDGRSQIQGHHYRGYDKPLDVQWLCVPCHRKETPLAAGGRSGSAKLRASEARTIRLAASVGMAQREIAKIFRVGRSTVRHCISGETWRGEARWIK